MCEKFPFKKNYNGTPKQPMHFSLSLFSRAVNDPFTDAHWVCLRGVIWCKWNLMNLWQKLIRPPSHQWCRAAALRPPPPLKWRNLEEERKKRWREGEGERDGGLLYKITEGFVQYKFDGKNKNRLCTGQRKAIILLKTAFHMKSDVSIFAEHYITF